MQPAGEALEAATPGAEGQAQPPPALNISGVVLNKAQLIGALRLYIPGIVDLAPLADGEHFALLLGQNGQK